MALTDPVIFNKNPLDIDPALIRNSKYRTWNAFRRFLNTQTITNPNTGAVLPFVNNPILNGRAIGKPISDATINRFNSTLPLGVNLINTEDVLAIQKYHLITDPNVQVDNWVGSQTSQMYYPIPVVYTIKTPQQIRIGAIINQPISDYTEFNSTKGYIAVTWGDKRYVIDARREADYATGRIPGRFTTPESEFIPYNSDIHDTGLRQDTFEEKIGNDGVFKRTGKILKYLPSNWNTWGISTTVSPGAISVNNITNVNNTINRTAQNQTTVTNQLLGR